MVNEAWLTNNFWREAVHIGVYILNRGQINVNSEKTPYELWKGRPTSIKHFRIFRRICYIKRDDENLGKFESRADEGIFLGYSSRRKKYICYNERMKKIVESVNVIIDEEIPHRKKLEAKEMDYIKWKKKNIKNKNKKKKKNKKNQKMKKKHNVNINKHHQALCRKIIQKN
jgi:hypothetical protein